MDPNAVPDAAVFVCKALVGLQAALLGVALVFSWLGRVFGRPGD